MTLSPGKLALFLLVLAAPVGVGISTGLAAEGNGLEAHLKAVEGACAHGGIPALRSEITKARKAIEKQTASWGKKRVQGEIEKEQEGTDVTLVSAYTELAPDLLPERFPARDLFTECAEKMSHALEKPSAETAKSYRSCVNVLYQSQLPPLTDSIASCLDKGAGAASK